MQQLNDLNAIVGECDRVVNGMLDGSITRDDGLFATAATLRKVGSEFAQFVAYALPILHTIDQAMRAAQAQVAQAQAQEAMEAQMPQTPQATAPRQQAPQAFAPPQGQPQAFAPTQDTPPANVVPINAGTSTEIQKVDGAPGARR